MKRSYMIGLTLATLFYLLCAPFLWAQGTYHWSKVRQGGKEEAHTWVSGINDAAWFVGNYTWLDNFDRGAFRFNKNTLYELSLPGLEGEGLVHDVGASTTIVGTYFTGEGDHHAFMYRHGLESYFTIDYPNSFWSFGFAVNNKNKAAIGYFRDGVENEGVWGAAIYDYSKKTYTDVTAFGSTDVLIRGINDTLDMVGSVNSIGDCQCRIIDWVRWKGVDYEMSLPDGTSVYPRRINNNGDVVGTLGDGRGFKMNMKTGAWEAIEHIQNTVAKGWATHITDIANNGQMSASVERVSNCDTADTPPCGYVEGWWVRPKTQVAKK